MVKRTQTVCRQQPTNCLNVFDHFWRLALKGLRRLTPNIHKYFSFYFIFKLISGDCSAYGAYLDVSCHWSLPSWHLPAIYFTPCSSVSIVNFEHANADWVSIPPENIRNLLVFYIIRRHMRD